MSDHIDKFILEVQRTIVQLLITQGNRLWIRFNYFLFIESALTGLYYVYKITPAPFIGIIFSIIWFIISAQDFYFLREHRERVDKIEKEIIKPLIGKDFVPLREEVQDVKKKFFSFRTKNFTVSHFSVYFSVIFLIFWTGNILLPLLIKVIK